MLVIAIEARSVVKTFGALRAVDGVSFKVERGETYGLLGPNGAGKTSIMRMLAGLSPISGGELFLSGLNVAEHSRAVRARLGVVTQADGLDGELSVRQNLEVFGFLVGLSRRQARIRADEVLGFFRLGDRASSEVDELSGGMRRRLAIARALMGEPEVIILDEPSTGLDPESRIRVWEELAELKRADVTLLMSTHYMDEAETLCDRIAIMHSGRILDEGTPPELVSRHAGSAAMDIRPNGSSRESIRRQLDASGLNYREVGALFRVTGGHGAPPALPTIDGIQVTERAANLEDVFLALAGRGLQEDQA
ncbi:MAG: ABC transporter ATP-binding protein [Gammaproteobacteria bacterium]|nr:ABC transporter ATP-binding protein [Gammaproteobacteria bacterium]